MPGLVLFRRRWSVGSDDFVYPSLLEIFLRLSWLIAISIVYGINHDKFTCKYAKDLENYFIGIFVFNIVSTIISIIVMLNSMKGAISDTFKRKHVPYLLYLKLIILFPECIWVLLGTYWAFRFSYDCPYGVVWTVKGTVIFSWVVGLIVCILIFLVFDPLGKYIQQHRLAKRTPEGCSEYQSVAAIKAWERRCGLMCCCIANTQQNRDAFTEISKLMADFFLDVDLVPTDIAAGLILIQKIQMKAENHDHPNGITTTTPPATASTIPTRQPWMTIKLMAHYMNFASASYGWPLFMYTNLGTGLCRLLHKSRCCSCIRQEYNIVQDNNCNCHTAAIMIQTGLKKEDLIYVSYHNKVTEIPFYVALDRKEMKVVVSIRGTMSLEDALTDLSAVGVNIAIQGVDNCYVHCGIFKCAKYIQQQLLELQLLEKAFNAFPDADGLVITGHSLGAGAAAILAMLLRQTYPELRCYAFSPPGGLLSPTASKHARDYICSVIVGKDVIPRLGIPTMTKLKTQILKVLTDCKHPKVRLMFALDRLLK
ncbi:hypothetical protein LOTGIDRAFT_106374 [Lottia gigantea]|uniref:sn-1-specific diacylglycerol lipase n=1 Tax=Lottia gigantea TaxID=225164 RepID=V3ZD05_LOTGI|nr:hypothetical protein LOTGIDRAFT_106374 [Lottia gigantea]ESO88978.1 hypothetical protein LOTGIDRAFT_106374 [Lottia gigantea]